LLAPHPTPKLEDHPLSAVRGCLFNLFTATLHIGGHSSICNLRTCHAVVTGTHIRGGGTNTLSQNIGNQSTYAVQQTRIGKGCNCIAVQATNLAIWRVLPCFYLAALVQQLFLTAVVGFLLSYFNIILNVKISIIFIFVTMLRPLKFPDGGGDSV